MRQPLRGAQTYSAHSVCGGARGQAGGRGYIRSAGITGSSIAGNSRALCKPGYVQPERARAPFPRVAAARYPVRRALGFARAFRNDRYGRAARSGAAGSADTSARWLRKPHSALAERFTRGSGEL